MQLQQEQEVRLPPLPPATGRMDWDRGVSADPLQLPPEEAPESTTQIPLASSPSTPMAMTELPVTGTKAVDGDERKMKE